MNKILLIVIMALFGCKSSYLPLETVENVDLEKYAGKWFSIAHFPTSFERGCQCTTAEYQATDKGYIRVINSCYKAEKGENTQSKGKAFVMKNTNNTKLKVQFFWPFRGDYWIIGLAEDYSWALVGHPKREYLWILSRTAEMNHETYQKITSIAKEKGFDINRLVKIKHDCW
jgi:apolipoprotein D and lipocalin family protein